MNEEEYLNLKSVFRKGRPMEIKKIKKETLLDFITETDRRVKAKEKEIATELETARLCNENYEATQKTLDESQEFIHELRELNSKLHDKVADLEKKLKESGSRVKQRTWWWIVSSIILILIIILAVI